MIHKVAFLALITAYPSVRSFTYPPANDNYKCHPSSSSARVSLVSALPAAGKKNLDHGRALAANLVTWQSLTSCIGLLVAISDDELVDISGTFFNACALLAPLGCITLVIYEQIFTRVLPLDDKCIEIKQSSFAIGLGAYSTTKISKGTFLAKYQGDHISLEELICRYPEMGKTSAEEIRDGQPEYVWRVDDDFFVDARDESTSNWCRFVNHAPGPSAPSTPLEANAQQDSPFQAGINECLANVRVSTFGSRYLSGGVYFFAARDVDLGEELCVDYGPRYWRGRETQIQTPYQNRNQY